MIKWFKQLDSILRGDATRLSLLQQGKILIPIAGLSFVIILLGFFYGLCMGSYAMLRTAGQAYMQFLASAVKFPLLFFLTLAVTFPSLYVFNALIGSRLSISSAFRLLIACFGVMLAVLASLGPIIVFFALCTQSYSFMVILNVAACTIAGVLGLAFLLRTMHRLIIVQDVQEYEKARVAEPQSPQNTIQKLVDNQSSSPTPPAPPGTLENNKPNPENTTDPTSALDRVGQFTSRKAVSVFKIWTIVFALVGAQMSWVLRPFIGNPNAPFEWFRERESNFFVAVFKSFIDLFSF